MQITGLVTPVSFCILQYEVAVRESKSVFCGKGVGRVSCMSLMIIACCCVYLEPHLRRKRDTTSSVLTISSPERFNETVSLTILQVAVLSLVY